MSVDPVTIAKLWLAIRPIRRWKERRARKRGEVSQPEEVSMFSGKLTYTSGIVLGLSWLAERFGIPVVPEEIESAVLAITATVSALGVLYGRWRATKKTAG